MKAQGDHAVSIGWHAEAFARTKRLKDLGTYLKAPATPAEKREASARDVMAMLDRMAEQTKS